MIVGVDISSKKIAVAILDSDGHSVLELESNKKDWAERLNQLHDKFNLFADELDPNNTIVYIEDIPYVRNTKTLIILVHFLAMCRLVLYQYGVPCHVVHTNTWKKTVGIATFRRKSVDVKKDIAKRCKKLYPIGDLVSQDGMDALLIAHCGKILENKKE